MACRPASQWNAPRTALRARRCISSLRMAPVRRAVHRSFISKAGKCAPPGCDFAGGGQGTDAWPASLGRSAQLQDPSASPGIRSRRSLAGKRALSLRWPGAQRGHCRSSAATDVVLPVAEVGTYGPKGLQDSFACSIAGFRFRIRKDVAASRRRAGNLESRIQRVSIARPPLGNLTGSGQSVLLALRESIFCERVLSVYQMKLGAAKGELDPRSKVWLPPL